jgi:hypothetical protein
MWYLKIRCHVVVSPEKRAAPRSAAGLHLRFAGVDATAVPPHQVGPFHSADPSGVASTWGL